MEIFVKAVYENEKDELWDSKLKRIIRDRYLPSLSDSSFRCAKTKLIEEGHVTVEEVPSKKKKAGIRISDKTRNKYLFADLQIPNTYLPEEQAIARELNYLQRLSKNRRIKAVEESEGVRRDRIVQWILIRANNDTIYPRIVVDTREQCLPGLIWTYVDKGGHSYSYEDIEYTLTEKQKEDLVPAVLDTVRVPGFSVMDLVKKRDIGSGGIFQYINTTREECEPIVNEHIDKKVLVQITYEEILEVIRNIKHYELYPFLLEEPRYKIADQVLSDYISDWNILQYSISKKIEISWLIKSSRLRGEVDLLGYYYGPKKVNNLRTRQKLVNQKKLKSEIDNRRHEPNDKPLKAYREERSVWDENIRKKLKEIRNKQEYAEIRNKFPALHELFIKPLKNNSRVLGKSKRDLDW